VGEFLSEKGEGFGKEKKRKGVYLKSTCTTLICISCWVLSGSSKTSPEVTLFFFVVGEVLGDGEEVANGLLLLGEGGEFEEVADVVEGDEEFEEMDTGDVCMECLPGLVGVSDVFVNAWLALFPTIVAGESPLYRDIKDLRNFLGVVNRRYVSKNAIVNSTSKGKLKNRKEKNAKANKKQYCYL
jgi:hypothetical protein